MTQLYLDVALVVQRNKAKHFLFYPTDSFLNWPISYRESDDGLEISWEVLFRDALITIYKVTNQRI
jgi:hypothetical protein